MRISEPTFAGIVQGNTNYVGKTANAKEINGTGQNFFLGRRSSKGKGKSSSSSSDCIPLYPTPSPTKSSSSSSKGMGRRRGSNSSSSKGTMDRNGNRGSSSKGSSTPAPSFFCSDVPSMAPSTPGSVVINEIMKNPVSPVSDDNGEWLELFNPGDQDVDINGWTLRDNGSDSHVVNNGGPLILPAGGYLVLGSNGNTALNGGVTLDYDYGNFFNLGNNDDDEIILEDLDGVIVDSVSYANGGAFPDPEGASLSLIDPLADNDDGSSWCTTVSNPQTQYGATNNYGTPGAANACPEPLPANGMVVISEIMNNPAVIADADGEWFELCNPGTAAVNINGWVIADRAGDVTINNNADLIIPAGGCLVLGRNADTATNGGVPVDYEYGNIFLNNSGGDSITISDGLGNVVDTVDYTSFTAAGGTSFILDDLTSDNTLSSNWCLSTSACCGGSLGTPGAPNDAC